jgi:hypothetical protein
LRRRQRDHVVAGPIIRHLDCGHSSSQSQFARDQHFAGVAHLFERIAIEFPFLDSLSRSRFEFLRLNFILSDSSHASSLFFRSSSAMHQLANSAMPSFAIDILAPHDQGFFLTQTW